jgi:hypothetical protein
VQFSVERMVDVTKKVACLMALCVCASSIGYAAGCAHINASTTRCSGGEHDFQEGAKG